MTTKTATTGTTPTTKVSITIEHGGKRLTYQVPNMELSRKGKPKFHPADANKVVMPYSTIYLDPVELDKAVKAADKAK